MNSFNENNKYDPNTVIAASNEKLAKNDIEGGQYIFQSALFEWVDDACEGGVSGITEAVATLWLAYANFLIAAQQYKTAGDIYEEAIRCPVTQHVGRIYAEYARFAVERNKRKTAQDVYIRALVSEKQGRGAVQDEQDRDFLWNEFLEMMKTTNPTLTMDALKEAVEQKHNTSISLPEPETVTSQTATKTIAATSATLEPAAKRARIETGENTAATAIVTVTRTHVVTEESVQELSLKFFQEWIVNTSSAASTSARKASPKHLGLPAELATAWMIIDGSHPPTIPEIMLFEPSPPKLSDPVSIPISFFSALRIILYWFVSTGREEQNIKNKTKVRK
jgi:tetratricopeptide (TPR) repeat protein